MSRRGSFPAVYDEPCPRTFMERRCLLLLLPFVFALPALAAEPQWVEVRSPNFSVITDAGDKKGREVALRFEQMRHVFGTLLLKNKVNIPIPLQIIAFRNRGGMKKYLPLWKGKPIEAAGLFIGGDDRQFILLDLSTPNPYQAVFHEYAHLLLNGNYPEMPAWFDEGFAEYYSTIKVNEKEFEFGDVPEYVPYVLQGRLVPVLDLFSVSRGSATYNESGDRRSAFYAQSWLVVHFLFDKQKLAETGEFCKLTLVEKAPLPEAFRRAFQMEPKRFDKELYDYYHSSSIMRYRAPTPAGMDAISTINYRMRRLTLLDAQVEMADVHLHLRDYLAQGITELENVAQQDPGNAAARRGLGYGYLRQGKLDKAAENFRHAVDLNFPDARVHYYAALLAHRNISQGGAGTANVQQMIRQLQTAISLDPNLADAYSLIGYAYGRDGNMGLAIENSARAIKLSPRNERYRLNLAQLYMQARRWDEAGTLLKYLQTSPDPTVAQAAQQNLVTLEQVKQAPPPSIAKQHSSPIPSTYDAPQWRPKNPPGADDEQAGQEAAPVKPDHRPIQFAKGRLVSVACAASGAATLDVLVGKRTLRMTTPDHKKLVLINADRFSCDWKGVAVAVNYRANSAGAGELVSLEVE